MSLPLLSLFLIAVVVVAGPLFNPQITAEAKAAQITKLNTKLQYLVDHDLKGKDYLVGNHFTVADSYLHIVLSWSKYVGVDLSAYPTLVAYYDRVNSLPFVKEAHAAMAAAPHAA